MLRYKTIPTLRIAERLQLLQKKDGKTKLVLHTYAFDENSISKLSRAEEGVNIPLSTRVIRLPFTPSYIMEELPLSLSRTNQFVIGSTDGFVYIVSLTGEIECTLGGAVGQSDSSELTSSLSAIRCVYVDEGRVEEKERLLRICVGDVNGSVACYKLTPEQPLPPRVSPYAAHVHSWKPPSFSSSTSAAQAAAALTVTRSSSSSSSSSSFNAIAPPCPVTALSMTMEGDIVAGYAGT